MAGNLLTVQIASGEPLDVRNFTVDEGLSRLFEVQLTAMSKNVDVDFDAAIGKDASFQIQTTGSDQRVWTGICARAAQGRVEASGLSTYHLRIVPTMWLLTQRRNYRIFQDLSELDIVLQVLQDWGIQPALQLNAGSYVKRRMRVQYAESDFDFVNRLLEDIGVTYAFPQAGGASQLTLFDAPNRQSPGVSVPFADTPSRTTTQTWVTEVQTHREVRPGKYTQSDVDYRKPLDYPLAASASGGGDVEATLERYHHNYGSFLWHADAGGNTPTADDRGACRTSETTGQTQVQNRLDAQRVDARALRFRTNEYSLAPGMVMTITGHPRAEVGAPLLVVAGRFNGTSQGNWIQICETRYTDVDYRPPLRTPKPKTHGIESATVTGPAGEQIHTDEFGRVRVHFHWDREGASDETSSCWVPVNQPWAGAGFGAINLPRVGQEVIVDFLGSDPDRPVVMGRVFTLTTPPPYQLPQYKMVSGMRSETYPRSASAPAQARLGGGPPFAEPAPWAQRAAGGPAGGGMPIVGLGAGTANTGLATAATSAQSTETAGANPGTRGGPPLPLSDLYDAVKTQGSVGSDGDDHKRSANVFMVDDKAHAERMYMQAQKDFYETVKQNLIGTVGANRGFYVGGNDTTLVKCYQTTEVGMDRKVAVGGKQNHFVLDDIGVQGQKNITTLTPNGSQVHLAKQGIMLQVGDQGPSTILLLPDAIVIDAQEVYINPGQTMMAALYAGKSAKDAAQAQLDRNKAAQAQIAANNKKIDELMNQRMDAFQKYYFAKQESDGYAQLAQQNPGNQNYQQGAQYTQQQTDAAKANVDQIDGQISGLRSQNAQLQAGS